MSDALHTIETPALLTIYEVAQQAQLWQQQLQQTGSLNWSLAALQECDAAGLQLLMAMAKSVQLQHPHAVITPPAQETLAHWLMAKLAAHAGADYA
ncbi:hypothetical protein [Alishewanella tabrizica]|uniref:STAS domain-containing protein n=1 Tax=Alishewanella tabrizica TaxID=671278 RepID=A0ABQ2WLJ1_9ALTE|nr:hypothetical protein [Alishewanella tabrizica]GGW56999.1 hypothetical protein GCM10008111_11260 [Alishewanella tabrizica]